MVKSSKSAPVGASLIVLSSFFYATYGIWTKLMGNFFEGYTASALRSVLVLLILLVIALSYHKFEPINIKQNGRYIFGMLVASLFTWGPLYYAFLHAGIGIGLATNYASGVIFTFFFGWLFIGERLTKDKITATVLAIIGLALIFLPSAAGVGWLALFAALVSGSSMGANTVFLKQVHYNAVQSNIAMWSMAVIANLIMSLIFAKTTPAIGWHIQWLYLVFFAVASVIASWLFVSGVKLIDAGAASVLGLLEIVFGVLFGVIFFSERLGAEVLLGIALIIAAAAIPYVKDYNAKKGTLT
jgi:drug/metabolite transporter (DMT)-like permease